jgi:hypothetical protein
MLHTVMRSSIDRARMTGPAYSMACPTPPPAPMRAMMARITSLAAMPGARTPVTVTRITRGLRCQRHWVASTCSTSVDPMPKASAPNAPCVAVWESPHTRRMPGWVAPCSGPITCTMPWRGSPRPKNVMPRRSVCRPRSATMRRTSGSAISPRPDAVGT